MMVFNNRLLCAMLHHNPASTSCMSEKVKTKMAAKYTSFVLHSITDAATHMSENTNVEIDVSMLLHI
jgi:hypothetical protein